LENSDFQAGLYNASLGKLAPKSLHLPASQYIDGNGKAHCPHAISSRFSLPMAKFK
jgi:hypothetical protein